MAYPYDDPEDSGPGRPDTVTTAEPTVRNTAPAPSGAVVANDASSPATVPAVEGGGEPAADAGGTVATVAPPPAETKTVSPTAGAQPKTPSFFDSLRAPPEVIEGLFDINFRRKDEMDVLRKRSEAALDADLRNVREAFNASAAGVHQLKPWNQQEMAQKYASDPIGAFGSLGSIFAMVASAFTNDPMTNSLNGMAAAMEAIKANDDLAYNRAHQAWKENTELAIKRHSMQQQTYNNALQLARVNQDAYKIKMQNAAARYGDEQALFLLENGLDKELFQLMEARDKQMKGTAEAYRAIQEMGLEAAMIQSSEAWQNADKEEDPAKRAAMKLQAWMAARNMTSKDVTTQLMGQFVWENPNATPKEMADYYNFIRWAASSRAEGDPIAVQVRALKNEYERRLGTDDPMSLEDYTKRLTELQRLKKESGGNINDPINAQQRELNRQREAGELTEEEWTNKTAALAQLKRAGKNNPNDPIQAMQAELNRQRDAKEITQEEWKSRSEELARLKRTSGGNAADPIQARVMKLEKDLADGTITRAEYDERLKALQAEKKANNSGATALTAERQIASDVAKAREKWKTEGKTDEEIADLAAEMTRKLRSASQPITANRRDQLDSMVKRWEVTSKTIDKIEALLKKHNALTGLGGTITRPMEVVSNWFGSNETDRAQFKSYIEELREWGPRLLNESQSRPLSAEEKRIAAIIPGLNSGDTTVNTAKRLLELQRLGKDLQTDLIRRRDSLPPTITKPTEPGTGAPSPPVGGRTGGAGPRWQDAPIVAPSGNPPPAADKRSDIAPDIPFGRKYAAASGVIESKPSNRALFENGNLLPADPSQLRFSERFGDWFNDPLTSDEQREMTIERMQELMTNSRERNERYFERLDRERGTKEIEPGGRIYDPDNPIFSRRDVRAM